MLILIMVLSISGCSEAQNKTAASTTGTGDVTFVELGSKRCVPCKMMQPVMEKVESEYAGRVKVVFYDVWTEEGKPYGEKYGIQAIPTQVFLDKEGKEFFRHTGFFSFNEIAQVLEKRGIKK